MIRITTMRLCILCLLEAGAVYAQPAPKVLRTPSLTPDGSTIAFSHQGDIWTVPVEGGVATRLTVHEGHDSSPVWNPDGTRIAFESDRFGHTDLFKMDLVGGAPQRLTFRSGNDRLASWDSDGTILFTTTRVYQQVEWDDEMYAVSESGGTPYRLLDAFGHHPAASPDGRFVAFFRGSSPVVRESYTGPADLDLWVFDTTTETFTQLTSFEGQDYLPDWGDNRTLYYLSASTGRYAVHTLTVDDSGAPAGDPELIFEPEGEGIRSFDVSADGSTLVYEQGDQIFAYAIGSDGDPLPVRVTLPGDYRFDLVEQITHTDGITSYNVSPDGEHIAFVVRGEVFIKKNDSDASRSKAAAAHPYRERDVAWLNDSTLVFASDRTGHYDLYLVRSEDQRTGDLFRSLKQEVVQLTDTEEDEANPVVSPDGKKLAFTRGRGGLVVADIGSGILENETVLLEGWASPNGVAWSPDSKWLAYSKSDLNFNEEVYIHPVNDSREPVNFTLHPREDGAPVWSADGSKLGFLSTRNNGDSDVWFVWLRKEDWEKTRRDWESDEPGDAEAEDADTTGTAPIRIDFEDIHERLTQVTRLPGNEYGLQVSRNGETFFFLTNAPGRQGGGGSRDLVSVKWDGSEEKTLAGGLSSPGSLALGPDGEKLYLTRSGGQLATISVDGGSITGLPFRAVHRVDHRAERRQIFNEAWNTINSGFYDPQFHGQDWEALRRYYEPPALSAASQPDFREIFNRMLGQLNASHMGLRGGGRSETQNQPTGLLGVEVVPADQGVRVQRVVEGGPASRESSRLQAGDVILAVDGEALGDDVNLYNTLIGKVGDRVLLDVEGPDGRRREVVIRPSGSLDDALYEEWIDERHRLTEEYSNGRLGYLHVEGMNWPSFERFERALAASGHGKEGLVIDVRYNGGGWTTDMLMTVLSVRQHAYTIPRGATDDLSEHHPEFSEHYPFGERLPLSAWTKPSVTLCNENSYSNAEIFSHAFKTLGIGKLVGQPTFGAVISTGGQRLLDGSFVRLPFRAWYVKATGENMELGPAVPDVLVENPPDYRATGDDAQLKRAVEVMLEQIEGE